MSRWTELRALALPATVTGLALAVEHLALYRADHVWNSRQGRLWGYALGTLTMQSGFAYYCWRTGQDRAGRASVLLASAGGAVVLACWAGHPVGARIAAWWTARQMRKLQITLSRDGWGLSQTPLSSLYDPQIVTDPQRRLQA